MAGATPSGIRAGRAFVEMFADPSKLNRALDAAKKRVENFRNFTAKTGAASFALGATAAAPIGKMFTDAVGEGAEIDRLARNFGSTAEQMSTLRGAFAQAGVTGAEFSGILEKLAERISHAADTNDFLLDSLHSLGTGREFMGMGLDAQFDQIAERIKAIPNAMDQVRAANELGLGSMLPLLKKGAAGMKELRAAAIANGDAMSSEQVKQAAELNREYHRTSLAVKSTLLEVGKALLPTGAGFADLGRSVRENLKAAREWVSSNKQVIVVVTAVALAFVGVGMGLGVMSTAAAVAIPILMALKLSVVTLYAVLAPFTGTAGLVVLSIGGIAAAIVALWGQTEQGKAKLSELGTAFDEFGKYVASSWKAMGDALSAGDWTLAFRIGIATADVAWKGFVLGLQAAWTGFKATFVDGWKDVVAGIQVAFIEMVSFIVGNLAGALKKMVEVYNSNPLLPKRLEIGTRGMKSKEEIQQEFEADKNTVLNKRAKEQADSNLSRNKAMDEAEKQFVDAGLALEDLKRQAAEAAKGSGWKEGIREGLDSIVAGIQAAKLDNPSVGVTAMAAKGIFSGSAQQSLGYGDQLGQRQLDGINNTAANTASAVTVLEQIRDKPAGIVVR